MSCFTCKLSFICERLNQCYYVIIENIFLLVRLQWKSFTKVNRCFAFVHRGDVKMNGQQIIPDTKKLEVTMPPLTAWQWQACALSILWGRECTHNWIFSNYIMPSCTVDDWSDGEKLYVDYIPHPFWDNCPWLKCRILDRKWIKDKWGSTRDFVLECVSDGYYIFTLADQKEIRDVPYQYLHELFLFGYNQTEDKAYIADFINQKFRFSEVDFSVACRAIDGVSESEDYWDDFRGGIFLLKFVDNIGYDFHCDIVKQSLFLYLNPQYFLSPKDLKSTRYMNNKIHYGKDVYNCFIEHIRKSEAEHFSWDQRAFHNLYDHKALMSKRIEYMMKKGYLDEEDFVARSKWIELQAQTLCNLGIKMNMKNSWDADKCIHMIDRLKEMQSVEEDLYTEILQSI